MPDDHRISILAFSSAPVQDRKRGLLGWISCSVGDLLRVDGIALRRTLDGRLTLSFPRGRGKCQPVRPLDDKARRAIERQILGAIDLEGGGVR